MAAMKYATGTNCIYCGNPAQDEDHVPPKCLFPRPVPRKSDHRSKLQDVQ